METHNTTRLGTYGWLGIAAFVVAFDRYAEESLTHAAQRGIENRKCRPFVAGAIGVTALHLIGAIPRNVDPYYRFVERYPC